ncbi:MAG TPA: endonuclease/exonuclease/phosphatase family protein [Geminicoccaceae bacterium]|nr:endonuclease/exonuclease/phosphatase family protein [Geminicoccus sp.]HMU48157.1 endonuclease/exonuclease/phosphatase family protein [Geminicoccaceae bacterium]
MLVTRTVPQLDLPAAEARAAVLGRPVTAESFHAAFAGFACLHAVECVPPPAARGAGDSARIVFWNAERLKYLEPSIALLAAQRADVLLLCEVDLGMARSGNRHTIAELARSLEAGWTFGAEFVELDLGDARERAWHAGQQNSAGLHGGGIVSALPLRRPALVRLETSGRWFDGAFGERRVGGRIAMMAEIEVGGRPVLLASAHYESHTGPADRLLQTRAMLDAIDAHAPGVPVLIGGDFNTNTFELEDKHRRATDPALAVDPHRLVEPQPWEPMFAELAGRGYDWRSCNVPLAATQRTRPDGTPKPPFGKIDWLFARGLRCCDPAVVPAVDDAGVAISDHEALAVTIAPA